jgi:hypothetical protein
MVLTSQSVLLVSLPRYPQVWATHPCSKLPESFQVDDVESTDMVRSPSKGVLPISSLPEPEPFHLVSIVTHGRVTIDMIDKFLHVCPNDLICDRQRILS